MQHRGVRLFIDTNNGEEHHDGVINRLKGWGKERLDRSHLFLVAIITDGRDTSCANRGIFATARAKLVLDDLQSAIEFGTEFYL